MAESAPLHPGNNAPLTWTANAERSHDTDPDPLREALKRCSARTYEAARQFRRTQDAVHLPAIVLGIIEHYVEPDLRIKLKTANDSLRLDTDLGVDSLTRIQIVMLVEEVIEIVIDDKELAQLQTLGDVRQFVERIASDPARNPQLAKAAS